MTLPPDGPVRAIYTVSRLNQDARALLEDRFGRVWVEGEIGDCSQPSSGHIYFILKDSRAQIRCALFRGAQRLCCPATKGAQVLVCGRVSLYEGRGDFQLIVEQMEDAGEGALRRAFEALKRKLAAEGLFESARKRPLPSGIRRIGVITSPDGAVWHDILTTLRRRFPAIALLLYGVPVQGPEAAVRIAAALDLANARAECDVLLLARGGGSLEDLWPFNEETVARAIVRSRLVVVSAIGHETDVTIADWVADVRAPTPTAAAELLSPDQAAYHKRRMDAVRQLRHLWERALRERVQHLDHLKQRLGLPTRALETRRARVTALEHRLRLALASHQERLRTRCSMLTRALALKSPEARLRRDALRLAPLPGRLRAALERMLHARRGALAALPARLAACHPRTTLARLKKDQEALARRLQHAVASHLAGHRMRLTHATHALQLVGPGASLKRGYAIVTDAHGRIVADAAGRRPGEALRVQLAAGELGVEIKTVQP